jgi:hypothetical protein
MSSAGSSRRSSLGNLMDAFKSSGRDSPSKLRKSTTDLASPLEPTVIIRNEEPTSSKWLENTHPSKLNADTSANPSLHYEFTKKDPMGEILLNIYEELTHLAKRTNKTKNTDIDDICEKFHNHNISQARFCRLQQSGNSQE